MSVVQIDTHHPIQDLIEVRDFLDHVIRRRQSTEREPIKPQSVEEQLAVAGKPLNLKEGAPENKLLHLVEPKEAPPLPIATAPEKPKRGRPSKAAAPAVVKTVTADEVRALMVERSKKGAEEIARQKQILASMGFEKVSTVPPERLVELKEKIEAE
jgi:hypothetical protein